MNATDRSSLTRSLSLAHKLLWAQAVLFMLAWLIPTGAVAVSALAQGIPDDGSAPYLLIPLIYSAPVLLFAVPTLVLAVLFSRGGRGVHTGVVAFEALFVGLGALLLVGSMQVTFGLVYLALGLLCPTTLPALYVLIVLLTPKGRAHFRPR
ncbi:hypothetical protein [Actinomadura sp. NPDC048394]|uniref:hypothetical protein n=1 Tax=Actinomadura sp. NPDC048394 TaxID=3158223 RepID=UPI003401E470